MASTSDIVVPGEILTPRLLLRPPRAGDGAVVNAAIAESFAELHEWMDWARELPSVTESEVFAVDAAARFERREELPLLLFARRDGEFVGGSGLHRIDWDVPSFEVGYWCRTSAVGRGYITEAVYAIAEMAFTALGANRIEVRMDDRNVRSFAVAERLGMTMEGVLRNDCLGVDGALRSTRVYSVLALDEIRAPAPPGQPR